jgi:S-formylglutathione hydrolase
MYSYVTAELPALVNANFPTDPGRQGIFGHSMGGHGALICALKNPDRYKSLSAFAPISSATRSPWGEKALMGYLGNDRDAWRAWDATLLAARSEWRSEVLVDQGTADDFLDEQLKPQLLQEAFRAAGIPLTLRYQAGYDHSYYFMASIIGEHIRHHARLLQQPA